MEILESVEDFRKKYLSEKTSYGFNRWTVVWCYQVAEKDLAKLPDKLRKTQTRPYIVTLADPLKLQTVTVCVVDSKKNYESFKKLSLEQFTLDLDKRLQGINPAKEHGFFEYESWNDFREDWLVRDGKLLIPYIFPLLFDFPDNLQFIDWQNTGACKISYQRCIVTVYLRKKNVFHDLFIKNVNEHDIKQYMQLVKAHSVMSGVWV